MTARTVDAIARVLTDQERENAALRAELAQVRAVLPDLRELLHVVERTNLLAPVRARAEWLGSRLGDLIPDENDRGGE